VALVGTLLGAVVAWALLATSARPEVDLGTPTTRTVAVAPCLDGSDAFVAAVDALAAAPPDRSPAMAVALEQRWRALADDVDADLPDEVIRQLLVVRELLAAAADSGRYAALRAEAADLERLVRERC
jgi:hypothetical protein